MLVSSSSHTAKPPRTSAADYLEELRGALEFARRDLRAWEREKQNEIVTVRKKAQSALAEASSELKGLQDSIAKQNEAAAREREAAAMEESVAAAEADVARLRRQVEASESERRRERATTRRDVAALQRDVELFEHLGLDLEGAGDGALRLRFTLLDKREPRREFSLVVLVDDDDTYGVLGCEPAIPDDLLTAELRRVNDSNDFSAFVKAIRRHFLALCAPPPSPASSSFDS